MGVRRKLSGIQPASRIRSVFFKHSRRVRHLRRDPVITREPRPFRSDVTTRARCIWSLPAGSGNKLGFGMRLDPAFPGGQLEGDPWKLSLEKPSLNPLQIRVIRKPKGVRLPIHKDEGLPIGPPACFQGQDQVLDFSAVHSRHIHERSVGHSYGLACQLDIGHLVAGQCGDGNRQGPSGAGHPDDLEPVGNI